MAKTKDLKNFEFGNSTDIGRVRGDNEDYMGYFECINGHVFIVCDGMGGHQGGAVAAGMAVENIRAYLENHYFDLPEDAMKAAIEYANAVIYRRSREVTELLGMGTTLVMAIIRNDKVFYAHAGDSRMYIFSANKLYRLTRDHSYVQKLLDKGLITEEEAENHPRKNEITNALGIAPEIEMDIVAAPLIPAIGDMIMLCTDGLNVMMNDEEIAQILAENLDVQHKAMKLTQSANEKGGIDNTTVQLIWFYNVANKKSKFVTAGAIPPLVPDKKTEAIPLYQEEEQNHTTPVEEINKKEFISDPPAENTDKMKIPAKRNKLIEKYHPKNNKKVRIALVVAAVLIFMFILWDLFIRQGAPKSLKTPGTGNPDTVKTEVKNDTVVADKPDNQSPVSSAIDTVWLSYNVKKGDVLGKIATKFNVPVVYIKLKNNLKNDNIRENQKLNIPVKADHTVKTGETLDVIAAKYKTDKEKIRKANGLTEASELKSGKSLIIPF